jgi:hypothetical protein
VVHLGENSDYLTVIIKRTGIGTSPAATSFAIVLVNVVDMTTYSTESIVLVAGPHGVLFDRYVVKVVRHDV